MAFSLDECIEKLLMKQLLVEALIKEICEKTKELLMRESNVVHISAPVTVVGDIHGQFYDLIEIFRIGGFCPDTNYLFLGKLTPHRLYGSLRCPDLPPFIDLRTHTHTRIHTHIHPSFFRCSIQVITSIGDYLALKPFPC